jgi:hypothetical protein
VDRLWRRDGEGYLGTFCCFGTYPPPPVVYRNSSPSCRHVQNLSNATMTSDPRATKQAVAGSFSLRLSSDQSGSSISAPAKVNPVSSMLYKWFLPSTSASVPQRLPSISLLPYKLHRACSLSAILGTKLGVALYWDNWVGDERI